ncbi:major Facilitator Superfamily protein [Pseudomonas aeruginosa PAK]|nr:major Facilitator Superfamily protein [Pseudomonas aeruginosa PAK]
MSARIPSGGQAASGVGAAEVSWVGLLVIFCLGINLRPILTGIGPLLEEITAGTGLGFQGASLLTVLPVLCMGLVALFLPWLGRWLAEHCGIVCGLLAIAAACLWRLELDSGLALIASAALAGSGVAIIQALVPGVVKRWFPRRVPAAMGLYSASLMAGGGTAAVLSPRIAEHFSNWQAGLGAWAVPALLALLLWMFARPREVLPSAGEGPVRHFFGNRRGWLLAVYFGLINGGYTSMVAWLPVYYRQLGWSAQDSGGLVGIMTIFQVLAVAQRAAADSPPPRPPALAAGRAAGPARRLLRPAADAAAARGAVGGVDRLRPGRLLRPQPDPDPRPPPRAACGGKPGGLRARHRLHHHRHRALPDRLAARRHRQLPGLLAAARGERGGDVAGDPALRPVRLCPGHGRDARLSGGPPRPPLQARVALQ